MRVRRARRIAPAHVGVAGVAAVGAGVLAVLATRVRDWVVMTDELQYAKLATAIAQGDVLPTLRGQHVSSYSHLYPTLLAPFYGWLSAPSAFTAAHVLNALLFATAALPAYLLSRDAALPRRWSLVVALGCVGVPWSVLTGFVLTESAAYAVFLWTVFAMHRSLVARTASRDLLAVGALALAFFTRTQFVVLPLAFGLAVVAVDGKRGVRRTVLLATGGLASVAALILYATGGVDRLLGRYAVTATEGSILPWRAFEQAGAHLDVVGIAIGLLPLIAGGAWLVSAARRREPYAVLVLTTIVVLTLATSSYDVRFGNVLRDRYLFYLAPLLLVALARALREEVSVYALASVVVFVAVTVFAHDFRELPGVHVDSPAAVLAGPIHDSGGPFLIAVASVVFAVFVKWTPPRARVVGAALVVFLTTGLTSATAWSRLLTSHSPSGRPVVGQRGLVLDWVDRVLPADAHVALIAYSSSENWGSNAILWWDVEFWNRTVDRSFVIDETWEYAPFPNEELEIDEDSGRVRSSSQPRFVIAAQDDARLRVVGARVGQNYGLDILEPERPYRADWITKELYPDGWMRSGTPATIRVFATPGSQDSERVHVEVVLRAPSQRPVGFRVGNGAARRMAGGEVVKVGRNLCIEPRSHAGLQLVSTKGARIAGVPIGPTVTTSRAVGPRVRAVGVSRTGERC